MLRNVIEEQSDPRLEPHMSGVLWDMFTGSAGYREIFLRTLRPAFLLRFAAAVVATVLRRPIDAYADEHGTAAAAVGGDVGQR